MLSLQIILSAMKLITANFFGIHKRIIFQRADILILVFLAIEACFIAYAGSKLIDPILLKDLTEDVWFGSDIERVLGNMTSRESDFFRTKVHPLFPIFIFPIVLLVKTAFNTEPIEAVRLVMAVAAAIWICTLFITLRLIGCRKFDAALFSVLMLSSAGAIFWFVVPETFLFGSLSMVITLAFAALAQHQNFSIFWYLVINLISFSITTTNWMAGIVATFMTQHWKRSLLIWLSMIGLATLLWRVQYYFFPTATFFLGDLGEERHYILPAASGGLLRVFSAFFFHSMVMPTLRLLPSNRNQPDWPMLSVQLANPGSGGLWSVVSLGLWMVMLILGAWSFYQLKSNSKFRITLALILLGQLALYTVYGEETFLYAVQIIPFLITLVALSTLTRWRVVSLALAGVLIITAGISNSIQFSIATEFLGHSGPLRQQAQLHPVEVNHSLLPK